MTFSCGLDLKSAWLSYNKFCIAFYVVNILPKFNKNLMKGSEDMEQTRNARLKLVTLNCDLDLGSAWLSYKFRTPSL